MKRFLVILLLVFPLTGVSAGKSKAVPKKEKPTPKQTTNDSGDLSFEEFEAQLKYQRGSIPIGNGFATLNVPDRFRYLNAEQSEKILVDAWGNPKGGRTLGMLFPSDLSPLSETGWGVVITFDEDGYVEDEEAGSLDYNGLLTQMKEETTQGNEERKKQGYPPVELIGWAETPHYDTSTHKLYWAKEFKFGDQPEHTLNYDIRVLGRKGVLSLNAVASMNQLDGIQNQMQEILGFVQFSPGNQYSDFNPSMDQVAAYGIGALIAGKIALKVGLFKVLLGALIALKKFIIIGAIALLALLRKFFSGRKDSTSEGPEITTLKIE